MEPAGWYVDRGAWWRSTCWLVWAGNFVANVIFIGTTIGVFSQPVDKNYQGPDFKSGGIVIFVIPAILCFWILIHSWMIMMFENRISKSRLDFHSGCLVGESAMIAFQFLTYCVWGQKTCEQSNPMCGDLFSASRAFAGISIGTEFIFLFTYLMMLWNEEADTLAYPNDPQQFQQYPDFAGPNSNSNMYSSRAHQLAQPYNNTYNNNHKDTYNNTYNYTSNNTCPCVQPYSNNINMMGGHPSALEPSANFCVYNNNNNNANSPSYDHQNPGLTHPQPAYMQGLQNLAEKARKAAEEISRV